MCIDNNDSLNENSSKLNLFKSCIMSEFNSFNEFLIDMNVETVFNTLMNTVSEEQIINYFQNLKKLVKNLKIKSIVKDQELS